MKTIFLFILLLAAPVLVGAEPLDEALEAFQKKEYATSLKKFTRIAEGSESSSVYVRRAEDLNSEASKEELVDYWQRNYGPNARTTAHFYLGVLYDYGFGVAQNYIEAFTWYEKAAMAGESSAEHNLALMYDEGHGTRLDFDKAFYWYSKAAWHGNGSAMNNLGRMYALGVSIPQNYIVALQWYNLASAKTQDSTKRQLAVENRDNLARKMTRGQIAQAQQLASQWKAKE